MTERTTGYSAGGVATAGGFFIPVEDATDEGRDKLHAGLGAGDGLGEGEEEDEDVMDAFALELPGALDAFLG